MTFESTNSPNSKESKERLKFYTWLRSFLKTFTYDIKLFILFAFFEPMSKVDM